MLVGMAAIFWPASCALLPRICWPNELFIIPDSESWFLRACWLLLYACLELARLASMDGIWAFTPPVCSPDVACDDSVFSIGFAMLNRLINCGVNSLLCELVPDDVFPEPLLPPIVVTPSLFSTLSVHYIQESIIAVKDARKFAGKFVAQGEMQIMQLRLLGQAKQHREHLQTALVKLIHKYHRLDGAPVFLADPRTRVCTRQTRLYPRANPRTLVICIPRDEHRVFCPIQEGSEITQRLGEQLVEFVGVGLQRRKPADRHPFMQRVFWIVLNDYRFPNTSRSHTLAFLRHVRHARRCGRFGSR